MSSAAKTEMTVDEFLTWTEGREGRWELQAGKLVEKSPERPAHGETRDEAVAAFKASIRRTGAPCHVAPEGASVRIATDTAFEPDVVVYCGPRTPPETVEIREPVIVVEVLSDSTEARDRGVKLSGYFALPSVAHYLILDPERRAAVHHKRGPGGAIESRVLTEGPLQIDPPGLAFFVEEFFPPR